MRVIAAALVVLCGSGCVGGGVKKCSADGDCPGGRCEASLGICVQFDGGSGGGGGSAGGVGGGGGSAGGVGGGGGTGGSGGGMAVDAGQCVTKPCSATTLCVDIPTGFRCDPRFTALVWKRPAGGDKFGNAAAFVPEVQLVSAAGNDGGGFPAGLTAQLPGMADAVLGRDGGTDLYGGISVTGASLTEGMIVLNVSFDGGSYWLDAGVTIAVDKTAPTAQLTIQSEPSRPVGGGWGTTGGWRRDERPFALIQATNEDISAATVSSPGMTVVDAGALSDCTGVGLTCPIATRCKCVQLDMSQPPLVGMTGSFMISGNVTDTAGNSTNAAPTNLPVTRLRWTKTLATTPIKSSPVVSKDGVVVVGTSDGASSALVAINPDGTTKWTLTPAPAPIEGGLSIAIINAGEYVGYGTTSGVFEAINIATPTMNKLACGSIPTTSYNSGLAVGAFGATGLVALRNSPAGAGTRLHVLSANGCDSTPAPVVNGVNWNILHPAAVVVSGTTIIMPGKNGNIRAVPSTAVPSATDLSMFMLAGYPIDLQSNSPDFKGLAFAASATKLVGAGSGIGQVFQSPVVDPRGATVDAGVDWRLPSLSGSVGAPTVRGGFAYFGYDQPVASLRHINLSVPSLATASFNTGALIETFPVAGDSELYGLAGDGTLFVSSFTPSTFKWSAPFATGVVASPTLDCARPFPSGPGLSVSGRPGTLYLPLGDGTLVAVIVDSLHLDRTAEWPKYQRDAYNSGNANSVGENVNPGCP